MALHTLDGAARSGAPDVRCRAETAPAARVVAPRPCSTPTSAMDDARACPGPSLPLQTQFLTLASFPRPPPAHDGFTAAACAACTRCPGLPPTLPRARAAPFKAPAVRAREADLLMSTRPPPNPHLITCLNPPLPTHIALPRMTLDICVPAALEHLRPAVSCEPSAAPSVLKSPRRLHCA